MNNMNNNNANILIVILGETRASELTYDNFKINVLDELKLKTDNNINSVDMAVCIGVKSDYDYNNPFYINSKYKFIYNESDNYDYAHAFDFASDTIIQNKSQYNIKSDTNSNTNTNWRDFLKIKDQFMGGIKDKYHEHPGSAGILIFYRWFLLHSLMTNNLLDKYDYFIITRSDFMYKLPHITHIFNNNKNGCKNIYIPDGEHYGGVTDRHVILPKQYITHYLDILPNMILRGDYYIQKMNINTGWNLEKLIKLHLQIHNIYEKIKFIPYIMYAVRNINGTTRWSSGTLAKLRLKSSTLSAGINNL